MCVFACVCAANVRVCGNFLFHFLRLCVDQKIPKKQPLSLPLYPFLQTDNHTPVQGSDSGEDEHFSRESAYHLPGARAGR